MRMRRLGLIGSAIAFARSERGRRMIADARRKYDTPENRAKLNHAISNVRNRPSNPGGRAHRAR